MYPVLVPKGLNNDDRRPAPRHVRYVRTGSEDNLDRRREFRATLRGAVNDFDAEIAAHEGKQTLGRDTRSPPGVHEF